MIQVPTVISAREQDRKPHHVVRVLPKQAADNHGGEESGRSRCIPKDSRKTFELVPGNDPNNRKAEWSCDSRLQPGRELPRAVSEPTFNGTLLCDTSSATLGPEDSLDIRLALTSDRNLSLNQWRLPCSIFLTIFTKKISHTQTVIAVGMIDGYEN
jgi:hypothetical protein